ncbi:MAG: DUF2169 domain-containing protein, partial [Anaerolineae bacterium]|nr:DUF2169 domain-containing protein [Anaerolineae bacterium]
MEVINDTCFTYLLLPFQLNPPKFSLTFVIKGTFALSPMDKVDVAPEQLFPSGDESHPEGSEGPGSCSYEADSAYYKPRADLTLAGKCHVPGGRPRAACRVVFQVGSHRKVLGVIGDRYWISRSSQIKTTNPQTFTEMELRYENGFGGEGYKKNPIGKGYRPVTAEDGTKYWPLPNIEDPGSLIASPDDRPEPAGFGPLGRLWQHRISKMGSYGGSWFQERWPWFPADFDWGYFNAAPPDMQVEGYLRGDEELYFENLHTEHSQYRSRLPGLRVRCFLNELQQRDTQASYFHEVLMNLDTLWVDMEAEKLVLVWRGVTDVKSEAHDELQQFFIVDEPLEDVPKSIVHYRDVFTKRLAELEQEWNPELEEPEPGGSKTEDTESKDDSGVQEATAQADESIRSALVKAGIDPDNPVPPHREF